MGGCATKPKVINTKETTEAPPPAPKPNKEDKSVGIALALEPKDKNVLVSEVPEKKEGKKDKVEGDVGDTTKEVVDDDKSTEEQVKHRSLSNLLMENEQSNDSTGTEKKTPETVKDPIENGKTILEAVKDSAKTATGSSELVKIEAVVEPEKPKNESATQVSEVKASETQVEETSAQEFVDVPSEPVKVEVVVEPEKPRHDSATQVPEDLASSETQVEETSAQEFVDVPSEPVKVEVVVEPEEPRHDSATQVPEDLASETQVEETSAQVFVDLSKKPLLGKVIETVLAVDTQFEAAKTTEVKDNAEIGKLVSEEKTASELKENSTGNVKPVEKPLELKENYVENPKPAVLDQKTFELKGNSVENVKQAVSEEKTMELNKNSEESVKLVTEEKTIELN